MKKKTIITILLAIIGIIGIKKVATFVYDKIEVANAPTMQELTEANPWTVPADWFKTDTITIKGRIEDYNAEEFGFSSMECYYDDIFENCSNSTASPTTRLSPPTAAVCATTSASAATKL